MLTLLKLLLMRKSADFLQRCNVDAVEAAVDKEIS